MAIVDLETGRLCKGCVASIGSTHEVETRELLLELLLCHFRGNDTYIIREEGKGRKR